MLVKNLTKNIKITNRLIYYDIETCYRVKQNIVGNPIPDTGHFESTFAFKFPPYEKYYLEERTGIDHSTEDKLIIKSLPTVNPRSTRKEIKLNCGGNFYVVEGTYNYITHDIDKALQVEREKTKETKHEGFFW